MNTIKRLTIVEAAAIIVVMIAFAVALIQGWFIPHQDVFFYKETGDISDQVADIYEAYSGNASISISFDIRDYRPPAKATVTIEFMNRGNDQ